MQDCIRAPLFLSILRTLKYLFLLPLVFFMSKPFEIFEETLQKKGLGHLILEAMIGTKPTPFVSQAAKTPQKPKQKKGQSTGT